MCAQCDPNPSPASGDLGIRNAEQCLNQIKDALLQQPDGPISIPLAVGIANANAQLAQAMELQLIRKTLEMMFLGGASVVPQASDTSKGGDDTEHPA